MFMLYPCPISSQIQVIVATEMKLEQPLYFTINILSLSFLFSRNWVPFDQSLPRAPHTLVLGNTIQLLFLLYQMF